MKNLMDRGVEMAEAILAGEGLGEKDRMAMAFALMQYGAARDGFRIGASSAGKEPKDCPEFAEMTEGL